MSFPSTEIIGDVIFESFATGTLQSNCSIIGEPVTKRAIVVDPGADADSIMDRIESLGLSVVGILLTHAHLDHVLASGEIKKRTGANLSLHKGDKFLWDSLEQQCRQYGIPHEPIADPDHWLADEDSLPCCHGVALHTPGHTPGSMCFWFADHRLLVAGDTLFQLGIGRVDIQGGSFKEIENSITKRLFSLEGDALVVTGHGPNTSLAFERRANPFFGSGL